jgi:cellulose synthase operon protein YhjQ
MSNDKVAPGDFPKDGESTRSTEDVGGFFTWANLDGSKYRDYSASREKSRADARGRNEAQLAATAEELPVIVAPPTTREVGRDAAAPARPTFAPEGAPRKLAAMTRGRNVIPGPRRLASRSNVRSHQQHASSRWVALKGAMDPELNHNEEGPFPPNQLHLPTLAFVSLAGGTGKTSLAASVGCLLAAEGLRTLLVDTHIYGLMPLFFGARELSPGSSRTFASPESASVRVMTLDRVAHDDEHDTGGGHSPLEQIVHHAEGVDRILIDVQTASIELLTQILPLSPAVLVVLVPDMASVVSLQTVQQMLEDLEHESGRPIEVFYLLNQFDASLRLHRDVRERLTRQLGKRFLLSVVHRSNAVSEALAQGMTVVDYAPEAQTTQDLGDLTQWVLELNDQSTSAVQNVRWGGRQC